MFKGAFFLVVTFFLALIAFGLGLFAVSQTREGAPVATPTPIVVIVTATPTPTVAPASPSAIKRVVPTVLKK